jgi:hypothetical protein
VTVTVSEANSPPTANDDAFTVSKDSGATELDVLANDTTAPDVGETLSLTAVTQPANGTVTFTATRVRFTPAAGFVGTTTFTYTVSDGKGGLDTATVTVTVSETNSPPVANDDAFTVKENSGATDMDVLANDTTAPDVGETLRIVATTQPDNGSVLFTDTRVNFAPVQDFVGTTAFTYTVSDGRGGTSTATVTVTVTEVKEDGDGDGEGDGEEDGEGSVDAEGGCGCGSSGGLGFASLLLLTGLPLWARRRPQERA